MPLPLEPRALLEHGGRGSHPSPILQAISLVVSGIMLGLKFGGILALPARFPKMTKWRATAQPLRAAADLGIELRPASGQPDLTKEEYMEGFEKMQQRLAEWAAKAVPAGLENGSKFQSELEKAAQKFSVLIQQANEPDGQPDAPPPAVIAFAGRGGGGPPPPPHPPPPPPPPPTHTHTHTHTPDRVHRLDCLHSPLFAHLRASADGRSTPCACSMCAHSHRTHRFACHHSLEIPVARRGDVCYMGRVSWYRVQPARTSSRRAYRNVPAWLRRALGLGKRQDAAAIQRIVSEARAPKASAKPRIMYGSDDEQVVLPP
jgi:hypothetical protein